MKNGTIAVQIPQAAINQGRVSYELQRELNVHEGWLKYIHRQ